MMVKVLSVLPPLAAQAVFLAPAQTMMDIRKNKVRERGGGAETGAPFVLLYVIVTCVCMSGRGSCVVGVLCVCARALYVRALCVCSAWWGDVYLNVFQPLQSSFLPSFLPLRSHRPLVPIAPPLLAAPQSRRATSPRSLTWR
jgi:hypothetical protein